MIRYQLQCENGHGFEGWFASSADHERQATSGLVTCPQCGIAKVSKALMAPSVSTSRKREARASLTGPARLAALPGDKLDPQKAKLVRQMRAIRDELLAGSDNVGNKFPEEARKIHYGESEPRGIVGQASLAEAAELIDEGIVIVPIPELPEERN